MWKTALLISGLSTWIKSLIWEVDYLIDYDEWVDRLAGGVMWGVYDVGVCDVGCVMGAAASDVVCVV